MDRILLRAGEMDKEVQKGIKVTYKGTDITKAITGIEVMPTQLIKLLASKDTEHEKITADVWDELRNRFDAEMLGFDVEFTREDLERFARTINEAEPKFTMRVDK